MHQLQNNKLPKLFQDLFRKIETVHGHNTRYASKNIYFWPRVKKYITQNLLAFRGSKLWTNIDDVYKKRIQDRFLQKTLQNISYQKVLINLCYKII